jgi:hypothetical protein
MMQTICVPIEALSVAPDSGKAIAPEVGDTVDITGTAKVERAADGKAWLSMQTVNEMPVETMADKAPETDPSEDDLERMAQEEDAAGQPSY